MEPNSNFLSMLKHVPGFVLVVCGLNIFVLFLSFFSDKFYLILECIPYYFVTKFEIWRLVTSPFVPYSMLELLISLPAFWSCGSLTEKRMGSVKYSLFFFLNSILVQGLYIFVSFIFSSISIRACRVLWGQIMTEIYLISRKNPDSPIAFLCCPGKIKSVYYPYLFCAIFAFLGYSIELFCGFLIGFVSNFYLDSKISLINLSRSKIEYLQSSLLCGCFFLIPNSIQIADAGEEELPYTFVHLESSPSPPRSFERPADNQFNYLHEEDYL